MYVLSAPLSLLNRLPRLYGSVSRPLRCAWLSFFLTSDIFCNHSSLHLFILAEVWSMFFPSLLLLVFLPSFSEPRPLPLALLWDSLLANGSCPHSLPCEPQASLCTLPCSSLTHFPCHKQTQRPNISLFLSLRSLCCFTSELSFLQCSSLFSPVVHILSAICLSSSSC